MIDPPIMERVVEEWVANVEYAPDKAFDRVPELRQLGVDSYRLRERASAILAARLRGTDAALAVRALWYASVSPDAETANRARLLLDTLIRCRTCGDSTLCKFCGGTGHKNYFEGPQRCFSCWSQPGRCQDCVKRP